MSKQVVDVDSMKRNTAADTEIWQSREAYVKEQWPYEKDKSSVKEDFNKQKLMLKISELQQSSRSSSRGGKGSQKNKLDKLLYMQFLLPEGQPRVFIRGKDQDLLQGKQDAEIEHQRKNQDKFMKKGTGNYLERYSAQIMDSLEKQAKQEQMKFVKTKAKKSLDLKSQMLKEFLSPEKGNQYKFKNIDLDRVDQEKQIKQSYMPMSRERLTIQVKKEVSECKNFDELKQSLKKNEGGESSIRKNPLSAGRSASPQKLISPHQLLQRRGKKNARQLDHKDIDENNDVILDGDVRIPREEFIRMCHEYDHEKYLRNKLRLRYNPQQLTFRRAAKAENIANQGGLVDQRAQQDALEALNFNCEEVLHKNPAANTIITAKQFKNMKGMHPLDRMGSQKRRRGNTLDLERKYDSGNNVLNAFVGKLKSAIKEKIDGDKRDGTKNMREMDQINRSLVYHNNMEKGGPACRDDSLEKSQAVTTMNHGVTTDKTRQIVIKQLAKEVKSNKNVNKLLLNTSYDCASAQMPSHAMTTKAGFAGTLSDTCLNSTFDAGSRFDTGAMNSKRNMSSLDNLPVELQQQQQIFKKKQVTIKQVLEPRIIGQTVDTYLQYKFGQSKCHTRGNSQSSASPRLRPQDSSKKNQSTVGRPIKLVARSQNLKQTLRQAMNRNGHHALSPQIEGTLLGGAQILSGTGQIIDDNTKVGRLGDNTAVQMKGGIMLPARRQGTQNFKKQLEQTIANRDKNKGGARISYNDGLAVLKKEKLDALQEHANEIKQEARKELIMRQVTNPKVSQIQNHNEQYVARKRNQKIFQEQQLGPDQLEMIKFEMQKQRMVSCFSQHDVQDDHQQQHQQQYEIQNQQQHMFQDPDSLSNDASRKLGTVRSPKNRVDFNLGPGHDPTSGQQLNKQQKDKPKVRIQEPDQDEDLKMLNTLTDKSPGKHELKPKQYKSALIEEFKEQVAKNNSVVKVVENNAEFGQLVKESRLSIFAFFASWSPPCQHVEPIFGKLAEDMGDYIGFYQIDVDNNKETGDFCSVGTLPTFLYFKAGKRLGEVSGANIEDVKKKMNEILKRVGDERFINAHKNRNLADNNANKVPESSFKKKLRENFGKHTAHMNQIMDELQQSKLQKEEVTEKASAGTKSKQESKRHLKSPLSSIITKTHRANFQSSQLSNQHRLNNTLSNMTLNSGGIMAKLERAMSPSAKKKEKGGLPLGTSVSTFRAGQNTKEWQNFEAFHAIKRDVEEFEAQQLGLHYWFRVTQYSERSWVPQAREGAVVVNVPGTNILYLYGGVAQEPMNGMAKLTVFGGSDCRWDIVQPSYKCDKAKLKGRYGFQGTFYNNKLYFFFGCQVFDKHLQERTCLNEVVTFDPFNEVVDVANPHHNPDRYLEPRKYFAGVLLGNSYYVHGGKDTQDVTMDSFIEIDLMTLEWSDVRMAKVQKGKPVDACYKNVHLLDQIHSHRMCVVSYKRSFVSMHQLGDLELGSAEWTIKLEGVYLFGGVTGLTSTERRVNNRLFVLPIGSTQLRWKEVETTGLAPKGRYHHSMHFYDKGNMLIVYGGKKFALDGPLAEDKTEFVDQVCVLRADTLEWFEIKYQRDSQALDRFPLLSNFSSALIDDHIVVFGGMKDVYTQSKDMYCFHLDTKRIAYTPPAVVTEPSEQDSNIFNIYG